jgi:hypothetical protein
MESSPSKSVRNFHIILRQVRGLLMPLHSKFRQEKVQLFFQSFRPNPADSLLDVGGAPGIGTEFSTLHTYFDNVWLLNIRKVDHPRAIVGDACEIPLADKSIDWVFSNALIEHVGSYLKQKRMADEVRRVARKGYFVATPNRFFPIDPHTYVPFLHLMPEPVIDKVADGAYWMLSPGTMRKLFPDARVHVVGFGTSIVSLQKI